MATMMASSSCVTLWCSTVFSFEFLEMASIMKFYYSSGKIDLKWFFMIYKSFNNFKNDFLIGFLNG